MRARRREVRSGDSGGRTGWRHAHARAMPPLVWLGIATLQTPNYSLLLGCLAAVRQPRAQRTKRQGRYFLLASSAFF